MINLEIFDLNFLKRLAFPKTQSCKKLLKIIN